ncbi:hypothetical protein AB0N33_00710 [Pseudarthrobacter oxydans]|uniref:hypothetical protein n=1 Tax=Pseudarthrobacter oxydans TaxID=1671 RepID=UPI00341D782E
MPLHWVSVNANTGDIITDLTNLRPGGSLKRTIGRHETQTATLPLDGAPSNWRTATRKKSVFLVALEETPGVEQGVPVWGGMVTERSTTHAGDVALSLVTAEDYLNDRYVRDRQYFTWPQNDIVEDLVTRYVATTPYDPGLPLRVVKLPGANPVRGRTYLDADDKTVFSALDELSGVIGGPEWTIEWEWVDERRLGLVLYVGARLGAAPPDGIGPSSWFSLPGNVQDAELTEGYRRGEGANDVMAVSSGVEDARPQSYHQQNPIDGRPRIEFRWTPSSSITQIETLNEHARRALEGMQHGTVALAITATADETTPFRLGDDVGFDLTSPAWPDGITGTARALGIEWTDTTITPVLDVTGIEGID